jgi:hypothetical protein
MWLLQATILARACRASKVAPFNPGKQGNSDNLMEQISKEKITNTKYDGLKRKLGGKEKSPAKKLAIIDVIRIIFIKCNIIFWTVYLLELNNNNNNLHKLN